jgi:hypothetical protein
MSIERTDMRIDAGSDCKGQSSTGPDDGGTLLIRFLLAVYAEPRKYVVKYRRVRRKHLAIRHSAMHGSLKARDVWRLLAYFGLGMMLLFYVYDIFWGS